MTKSRKYHVAVNLFNADLCKQSSFILLCLFHNKDMAEVINALQCRLYTKFNKKNNEFNVCINFTETKSQININHSLTTNF